MVSTTRTKSSNEEIESLLSDADASSSSLAGKAVTPEVIAASELSRNNLREVAHECLSSALLSGSEQDIDDVVKTVVRQEVREKTLRLLLAEIQVLLTDMAAERSSVSTQAVQKTTSRAIAQISSAYKKEKVTATEGPSRNIVRQARTQAESVTERSTEIASLTEQQAANMSELSDEVGDVSAAVEKIAVTTDEVNEQSAQTADLAEEGLQRASDLQASIDRVHDHATAVNQAVETLAERVVEIDEFVDTIDDIAEQTNMLALNASIEAARVDGSEGFAVVADEIKSLAEDSQEEAAHIRGLVENIDAATSRVTDHIEGVYEETENGRVEADRALETFESIEDVTARLSDSLDDVATATSQQAESTEELAMMADEADRKVEMILEEIGEISEGNERLVETLNASNNRRADEQSSLLEGVGGLDT